MAETNNHDLVGINKRIKRFAFELVYSVSSGVSEIRSADMERLQAYLHALTAYKGWVVSQPQLDLPASHPRIWEVEDSLNLQQVENEMVDDLVHILDVLNYELLHSQSSRLPQGLNEFDSKRFDMVMRKAEDFVSHYIEMATPLDLPESSPKMPSSGKGRTGINPS